jgi:hypothetical protein
MDIDDEDESYFDSADEPESSQMSKKQKIEIQKMFSEIEARATNAMNYLVAEGFLERTEDPYVYRYTPEGLVMAHQQYKKIKEKGI